MTAIIDIVLPCLDEAGALPWVLVRIPLGARAILVDDGSRDASPDSVSNLGAEVMQCEQRGYDAACHTGLLGIGFRDPLLAAPAISSIITMSTAHAGVDQRRHVQRLGARVQLLDELRGVDTIADADKVAATILDRAFAAALSEAGSTQSTAGAVR